MKIMKATSKGNEFDVLVDDDFFWSRSINVSANGYARIVINNKFVYLHRHIMSAKKGEVIDHINRNKLDNRRENLRVATKNGNHGNKIHKGYYYSKLINKYCATITFNKKTTHLGVFKTPEEAQEVYRKAHAETFGEFSPYYKYYSGNTKEESK